MTLKQLSLLDENLNLEVKHSNRLSISDYNMQEMDYKLFLYGAALWREKYQTIFEKESKGKENPDETAEKLPEILTFSLIDFSKETGIPYNSLKKNISRIAKRITGTTAYIQNAEDDFEYSNLANVSYKRGIVQLRFPTLIRLYMLHQKHFTLYKIINILKLEKGNSIRLYQYFKSIEYLFQRNPNKKMGLEFDELCKMLVLGKSYQTNSNNLIQKIIKPCVEEINSMTDLTIEYTYSKTGRKKTGLEFIITSKKTKEEFSYANLLNIPGMKDKAALIREMLHGLGLTLPEALKAREIADKACYDKKSWPDTIHYYVYMLMIYLEIMDRKNAVGITSPKSYFFKSLEKDTLKVKQRIHLVIEDFCPKNWQEFSKYLGIPFNDHFFNACDLLESNDINPFDLSKNK